MSLEQIKLCKRFRNITLDTLKEWNIKITPVIFYHLCGSNPYMSLEMIEYCVKQQLPINDPYIFSWICKTNKNMSNIIQFCLDHGCNLNGRPEKNSSTAFYDLIVSNKNELLSLEIIKLCIDKGADLNAKCHGRTPFHLLCRYSHIHPNIYPNIYHIIQYCIDKSIDLDFNCPDASNRTPFHYICINGDITIIRCLVSLTNIDIDMNVQDNKGNTPMHYICMKNLTDLNMFKNCVDNRSGNLHIQNKLGYTPIEYSHKIGYINSDMLKYLVKNGVDINRKVFWNESIFIMICRRGVAIYNSPETLFYCFKEANVKITDTLFSKIIRWLSIHKCFNLEVLKYFHENGIDLVNNCFHFIDSGKVNLEILKYLFSIGLSASNITSYSKNPCMDLQMIKYLVRTHGVILNGDNFMHLTQYFKSRQHIHNYSNMDLKSIKYFVKHGLDMKDPTVIYYIYVRYLDDKAKLYKYMKKNGVTFEMCTFINARYHNMPVETLLRQAYLLDPIIVNVNHDKDIIVL